MDKIIFLGCTQNYPLEFNASNTKTFYLAKGLLECNCEICIINSVFGCGDQKFLKVGFKDGIKYYTFPKYNNAFSSILHNLMELYKILKREYRKDNKNIVIYCFNVYPVFLLERLIVFLSKYNFFCILQEWHISVKSKNLIKYIFNYLFDHTFGYFSSGIFPISHKLRDLCRHFNKEQLIIPVLSDYECSVSDRDAHKMSFSYCCDIGYLLRNDLIIKAFQRLLILKPNIKLNLILTGNKENIFKYERYLETKNLGANILIKNQIPFDELNTIFRNSIGLLIPLDPNSFQDISRFSQKIAEYVATKRPIITNNVGEIPYYFKDKESAIIVNYSIEAFVQGMLFLVEHPDLADYIGLEGMLIGKKYFDYKVNGKQIFDFIHKVG